ncbi:MAG: hypothetical protein BGO68_04345 [Candidatus Amoebophilus sp. 36-38]|nr:MAG: hypothetical protein BGO68_04345 [Candidatus Amoebophilus sp. 36-38]
MVVSCKNKKAPKLSHPSASVPENEQTEPFNMSVKKSQLIDKQKTINLTIKAVGQDNISCIQDFKLQVKFLEEQAFESHISYENTTNQKETVTYINKALKEFKDVSTKITASTKKQLTIPIKLKLNPADQATKLTLGIELLDQQHTVLQKMEVVWMKGKLLVRNIDELVGGKIGSFILKNATDHTFDANKIELNLSSSPGIICQFVKTNTHTATLRQLLKDDVHSLKSDTETEPIEFKVIPVSKSKNSKNEIKLILTQEPGKIALVTHKITYKHPPTPSETESRQEKSDVQKNTSESRQQENTSSHKTTTEPQKQESTQKVNQETQEPANTNTSNQEYESAKKEEEKQSKHPSFKKASDKNSPKQQARSKKKSDIPPNYIPDLHLDIKQKLKKHGEPSKKFLVLVQNKGQELSQETLCNVTLKYNVKGEGDLTNVRLKKRRSQTVINGAKLGDLLNSGLAAGNQESFELLIESGNAENLVIELFLEGVKNTHTALVTWKQVEKIKQNKNETSPIPDLELSLDKRDNETIKMFNLLLKNKGEKLSKEDLNNIKIKYTIEGIGDLADVKLTRRKSNLSDIQGQSLGNLLNKGIEPGHDTKFQLIINSVNADSLIIQISLEGVKCINTVPVNWKKKEERKNKKIK